MAALDFPASPTVGQLYPDPAVLDIPQYQWDGEVWKAQTTPEEFTYVKRAGDTMAGELKLSGNPVDPLAAAPKQYVVAKTGDTMTGHLGIPPNGGGTHAVRRDYVDSYGATLVGQINTKVGKAGGSEGIMTGDLTVSRSGVGQGGHGVIQFGTSGTKYIFYDGTNFNFNLSGINALSATLNGPLTITAQPAGIGILCHGATTAAIYAIDGRARNVEIGGVIGYSTNNYAYGINGGFFSGAYYSFYGNVGAYLASGVWAVSDSRVKNVAGDIDQEAALAAVNSLPVKSFTPTAAALAMFYGKDETPKAGETLYGWLAQDVEQLVPIAVRNVGVPAHDLQTRAAVKRRATPTKDSEDAKALSAEPITVKAINDRYMLTTLWAAVQRLSAMNDELRAELNTLKASQ